MANGLVDAIVGMREEEALEITTEMLEAGEASQKVLGLCREAMVVVGERFEKGEYFIPHLIMGGEILKGITDIVKPGLGKKGKADKCLGKVVIGTVQGDIHDIGLNIVIFMLEVNEFEVYDLGVDVPPEKFVEKIEEVKAEIVGLSGFMTTVFDAMKETVEAIEAAGLRDRVKVMIGGGTIDDNVRKYTGADAFGKDAMEAVSLAQGWIGDS
jgi:methanogenic corrinoid protein MtbC1